MEKINLRLDSLGKLIKELREQKLKMSQTLFAKAIGADPSTIHRWETGKTDPMLSLPQVKSLLIEMKAAGLDPVDDLPDKLNSHN